MTEQPRSREARARAETALAALLDATGEHWREIVVIGGLVPDVIAPGAVAHQGTADVDVMLDLALVFDRDEQDFGWLEQALTAVAAFSAAFEPAMDDRSNP
ncbi:hypothetical protein [Microbacterium thalassium]|uniref:Uncharacterized protein n=1 Tax=Microbacterium thalassium TaxID=362649 RepID=A0A7X0KUE7_9MICO|nr:hypothetical protein [Microbacterium thalassium]MBB6391082.1 hypothetical protein [Microbacterium thalassium]GLK23807.1 hypothetical protein GCM10017607_11250 [Microbacterium thalassium]